MFSDSSPFAPHPKFCSLPFSPLICAFQGARVTSEVFITRFFGHLASGLANGRRSEGGRREKLGVFSVLAPSLPDHGSSCGWFLYRHSWAVGLGDKRLPPMATALISHRNSTSSITPPGLEAVMISCCCPDPGHLTILLSVSSALPTLLSIVLLLNSLRVTLECTFWFLLVTWLTHAPDRRLLGQWCSAMTPR